MQREASILRGLILVAGLACALALPATAAGKVHKVEGIVGGDPNSTVSMQVVVEKGKVKKVRKFAWSGLDGYCGDSFAGEQSGAMAAGTKVLSGGNFRQSRSIGSTAVNVYGKVKKRGRQVNGTIEVYFDAGYCNAPPLGRRSFIAKK